MNRRGQGEGSLYQRKDGRWAATLDLGWRDGRRVRHSLYAPTRREVVEKLKTARKAIDAGLQPMSDRMTVALYLEDWLGATRETIRPSTWTRYAGMVRTHLIPRLGDEALGGVWHIPSPEAISTRAFVEKVYAAADQPAKLRAAPKILFRVLGLVNPMIRELVEMTYEFEEPFVMNDAKFRNAFHLEPTALDEAIATTVDWFRSQRAPE